MHDDLRTRNPPGGFKSSALWKVSALLLLFLFRIWFGFFAVMDYEDQRQIYLIGLKYYCTGLWPYFGADVIPHVQIPGALQGLVVGIPLRLWAVPEAPFVLVNILSFAALSLFAWYCSKRLPALPKWIVWGWLFTAPWTLNVSTDVYNVSYVLFGSVLFFVGFLETIPALMISSIPRWLANLMMGFAFFWIAQFHVSYLTLVPFLAVSAYFQMKHSLLRDSLLGLAFFLLGAATTGSFLIPTLLRYGSAGFGGTGSVVGFHPSNFDSAFVILAQLFSLASGEVPRFIGRDFAERLAFFRSETWAAPFTVVTLVLGLLQPVVMLISGFRRRHSQKDWGAMKVLTLATFLLIYASFAFVVKSPKSHMYYLMLPPMMLFAFYVFSLWSFKRWFLTTAGVLLVCNLGFHVGMAAFHYREKSFYAYRQSILRAIEQKDYTQMGERRPEARY
jgi:hypothetical protein